MRKLPFIEGFKQPTLSKNSYIMLCDVRGDGQGKLVIWVEQQNQLIVYKGTNREFEKEIKIKNVSGMVHYNDQQKSLKPAIALCAENALYIFRGLAQSFRLRIPDIFAEPQQQVIWSQHQSDPEKLSQQLSKLNHKILSQTGQYIISASTKERKAQLISEGFSKGINQKDSISSISVICDNDAFSIGNIVLGTQLRRLYILDNYGHSIIHQRIINFVPYLLFAHGQFISRYLIVCISRQGVIQIHGKIQTEPIQTIKLTNVISSASFNFPDLVVATLDQTIKHYTISNSNFKIAVCQNTMKLNKQPIKVELMKTKNYKCILIAFQKQFRIYYENQLVYTHQTDFKLYNTIFGSFGREQGCLVLLYQNNGFQVLILHRQFNPKEKYGSNKIKQNTQATNDAIPIPKKTPQFMAFWKDQTDNNSVYKLYQKNLRLLKWRTLKQSLKQGFISQSNIQINSKIVGMGPSFLIQLEIQNTSQKAIYQLNVLLTYSPESLLITKHQSKIKMLPPSTPYFQQLQITSLSKKNQQLQIQLSWQNNLISNIVFIPNCQQIGD